jgi:hypothetical protein
MSEISFGMRGKIFVIPQDYLVVLVVVIRRSELK